MAVTSDGKLYSWGAGLYGQVGIGDEYNAYVPTIVPDLTGVVGISSGSGGSKGAITSNGDLYTWGNNSDFALGDTTSTTKFKPNKVIGASNVAQLSIGNLYGAYVNTSGDLYTWGKGSNGRLGHGDYYTQVKPKKIESNPEIKNMVGISVSPSTAGAMLSVKSDGTMYSWGYGYNYSLGHANQYDYNMPRKIGSKSLGVQKPIVKPTLPSTGGSTGDSEVEIPIESGELKYTVPNILPFSNTKLLETTSSVLTGFDGPIEISDSRGTLEGWKLTLNSTTFKTNLNGTNYNLPTGRLKLKQPYNVFSKTKSNSVGLNNLVPSSGIMIDGLGEINVASSDIGNGGGITNINFNELNSLELSLSPLEVNVDKVTKDSKYTSVITWSLTEAP